MSLEPPRPPSLPPRNQSRLLRRAAKPNQPLRPRHRPQSRPIARISRTRSWMRASCIKSRSFSAWKENLKSALQLWRQKEPSIKSGCNGATISSTKPKAAWSRCTPKSSRTPPRCSWPRIDEEAAAALLLKLKPRSASAILDQMDGAKAARLVSVMIGAAQRPEKAPENVPTQQAPAGPGAGKEQAAQPQPAEKKL